MKARGGIQWLDVKTCVPSVGQIMLGYYLFKLGEMARWYIGSGVFSIA